MNPRSFCVMTLSDSRGAVLWDLKYAGGEASQFYHPDGGEIRRGAFRLAGLDFRGEVGWVAGH